MGSGTCPLRRRSGSQRFSVLRTIPGGIIVSWVFQKAFRAGTILERLKRKSWQASCLRVVQILLPHKITMILLKVV